MLDKAKARMRREVQARPWLDHAVRAGGSYQRQRGDYFAAGITYFTVLALFPLLMVAFAVAGFVLSRDPGLLDELRDKIVENIPGSFGTQVNDLIDQAIKSRGTVGVLGLLGAAYAGLGWMANLRAALTEQWEQPAQEGNWFRSKLSDLLALLGLGLAMVVSMGLSALAGSGLARNLLERIGLGDVPGVSLLLRLLSLVLAVGASWAVFVWIIARLPRQPVTFGSAVRAAFIAAIAFEIWKQVASIYLQKVLHSPAGVAFGSIIGLMVFAYFTARIILFATAWAATARENEPDLPAPGPAVIQPRMYAGMTATTGAALFGVGAVLGGLFVTRRKR
ncbi:membrane protein [Nocardia nova SH22a]|uniref:Membrane protein n=1 Tax=Nocardia nova SH22a TaxID=1415166 RepID=W5T9P1_9NOCA|nr:membrane protein [Nocardia nova SH22a]